MIFPVGGRIIGMNFYVSNATWTRPENCTSIIVVAIGGGGGGSYVNSNGVIISGGSGSSTTFGSLITCTGGAGSSGNANGASGTASGGPFNIITPSASTKIANSFSIFTYGCGGFGVYFSNDIGYRNTLKGGSGGFGLIYVKDGLLDSYAITVGSGGASGTGVINGESGNAGAVLVIEFGG